MEISVNGKSVLELNQPQPFHREDFVCIKVDENVEHIYVYKENKSEKFVAFGLTYPNAGDNLRGPETMIVLLGVRRYEEK